MDSNSQSPKLGDHFIVLSSLNANVDEKWFVPSTELYPRLKSVGKSPIPLEEKIILMKKTKHLDYRHSREYYGVVRKGKIEEYEPGNPIVYKLNEVDVLRREYPKAKIVKFRMTIEVVSEVIL